ncbi:MAG: hypothetical protein IPP13_07385 [Kouleothrix sp.]|jgi:hypothetical protein|nr:hypothetical protein [Kouleothrix sp.]
MSQPNDEPGLFDPTGMLRGMRDASIDLWTKALLQTIGSEEYAHIMGTLLDSYMATSAPFRKLLDTMLLQFVQSEAYAATTRQVLDSYLATSAPFRTMLVETIASEAYSGAMSTMLDGYLAGSGALRDALMATFRQALGGGPAGRGERPNLAGWLDPTGMLQTMRDAGVDAWSGLASPTALRQMIELTMTQSLTQLNMPTRSDVLGIADRLSQIESRLDEIEERLPPKAERPPRKRPAE